MSNIGTNTHSQIDSFISSLAQASGIAALDSTSKLTSSQIPTLNLGSILSDCVITSPVSGQSWVYNGTQWANTINITCNTLATRMEIAASTPYILNLPTSAPTTGQILEVVNGSGTVHWITNTVENLTYIHQYQIIKGWFIILEPANGITKR